MSEPSNSSVQGLISSLKASAKTAVVKGDARPGTVAEDGKAFSRELDQALEKQSAVTPLTSGKPQTRDAGKNAVAADPASSAAVLVEAASQESQEQLTSGVTVASTEEALPVGVSGQKAEPLQQSAEAIAATPPPSPTAEPADAAVVEPTATVLAGNPDTLPDDAAKDASALSLLEGAAQAGQSLKSEVPDKAPVTPDQLVPTPVASPANAVSATTVEGAAATESDDAAVLAGHVRAAVSPQTPASPLTPSVVPAPPASPAQTAPLTQADTAAPPVPLTPADSLAQSVPLQPAAPLSQTAPLTPGAPLSPSAAKESLSQSLPLTPTAALAQATPLTPTAPLSQAATLTAAVPPEQSGTDGGVDSQSLLAASEGKLVLPGSSDARIPVALTSGKQAAGNVAGPAATSVVADSTVNEELVASRPLQNASPVQPAEVGEVISQAALAARYRFATNDSGTRVSAPVSGGNEMPVQASAGSVDGQPVLNNQPALVAGTSGNSLTAPGAEGKTETVAGQLPVTATPPGDGQPVLRHEDLLKDLQAQRAALNDSISLPGTASGTSPAEALLKPASADNMFLPVTGGIVTAPVMQRTDAVSAAPVSAPFELPLMAEDADVAMAGNLKWMAKEGVQNATVTVSPAGMGPISIKVGMEQDQMSVSIVASQHTTREALDAMLPRLREQLAGQGHESVKLDVSDGRGEQSRGGNGQMFAGTRNPSDTWTQGDQSNSGNNGNQTEYGNSNGSTVDTDRHMAEDLQRVALRAAAGSRTSSAFDAYV